MKDVAGKVAFVTGGASGLGLAMAHAFTGAGMKVAIADIEDTALEAAKLAFSDSNAEVITIKTDVTDRESMAQARQKTLDAFGKVHVVCNNAGVVTNNMHFAKGIKGFLPGLRHRFTVSDIGFNRDHFCVAITER